MKLRDYLLSLNITQAKFADLVGINRDYMNCIIRGKKKPGKHLAFAISKMTNGIVDAKGLMDGSGAYTGERKRCGKVAGFSGETIDALGEVSRVDEGLKNGDSRQ